MAVHSTVKETKDQFLLLDIVIYIYFLKEHLEPSEPVSQITFQRPVGHYAGLHSTAEEGAES